MTEDLVAWLRAQLDEDERAARAVAVPSPWQVDISPREAFVQASDGRVVGETGFDESAVHIARHDPARVLAEVAAKRRIIDRFEFVDSHGPAVDHVRALDMTTGARAALLDAVKMLASVYAGRPGWREEWATDEEVQHG